MIVSSTQSLTLVLRSFSTNHIRTPGGGRIDFTHPLNYYPKLALFHPVQSLPSPRSKIYIFVRS